MIVLINKIKSYLILIFVCFTVSIQAQDKHILSLQDCFKLAFKNNLTIKSANLQEQISSYQLKSKKTGLLPSINGYINNGYSWGRSINPNTNSFTTTQFSSYRGGISTNLLLFSGFSKLKEIKSFKFELEINKTEIQKIKNDLTIDIALSYITILYLKEILRANKEQIKSSYKQLEIAIIKFNSGYLPEGELFKIKSQKAREDLALSNTQNLLEYNVLDLKQFLQLPLNTDIELVEYENAISETAWLNRDIFKILDKAVEINPSYIKSVLQTQQAKNNIGISRVTFFPSLSFGGSINSLYSNNVDLSFNDQLNTNLYYDVNFTVTLPLFNKFKSKYLVKESKLSFEQSKIQQDIQKNSVSKIILNAINDAKSAEKKFKSSLQAHEFGKKSYEADMLKYKGGKINVNELNITKNNYINAQSALIQAKYEFLYSNAVVLFFMGKEFRF